MREETGRSPEDAATGAEDAPWRRYPHLDAAVEMEHAPVIADMERTWNEMIRVSQAGTAREQERARVVLAAYGRALELYRRLTDLRDQATCSPEPR
jgi:hypothetical protein